MRALTGTDILSVWERAAPAPAPRRPAAILGTADADELPLGARDAQLLRLYEVTFGDRLDGVAQCPACPTTVDVTVPCGTLLASADEAEPPVPVEVAGYEVHWRLPDSRDLAAAAGAVDPADGAAVLLDRCVTAATRAGAPVAAADLPDEVRAVLGEAMAAADPLAEVTLSLMCPQCTQRWDCQLDVGAFVWTRLAGRAQRVLREVDLLARAYGWSEPEILALSEARRGAYLRLVSDG